MQSTKGEFYSRLNPHPESTHAFWPKRLTSIYDNEDIEAIFTVSGREVRWEGGETRPLDNNKQTRQTSENRKKKVNDRRSKNVKGHTNTRF